MVVLEVHAPKNPECCLFHIYKTKHAKSSWMRGMPMCQCLSGWKKESKIHVLKVCVMRISCSLCVYYLWEYQIVKWVKIVKRWKLILMFSNLNSICFSVILTNRNLWCKQSISHCTPQWQENFHYSDFYAVISLGVMFHFTVQFSRKDTTSPLL